MTRRTHLLLAAGAASVLLLAGALFLLTRPTADLDGIATYSINTWGSLRADDVQKATYDGFRGTGTLVGSFSIRNRRDHPVVVSVSAQEQERLALFGIKREVRFVPYDQRRGYGAFHTEADLARGSTTIPAHAEGEIVQVFRVSRCQNAASFVVSEFPLDVDGHPALVEVSLAGDQRELRSMQRVIADNYRQVNFGSCCVVDRTPTEQQVADGVDPGCVGDRVS